MNGTQCKGFMAAGHQCKRVQLHDYCWQHDPAHPPPPRYQPSPVSVSDQPNLFVGGNTDIENIDQAIKHHQDAMEALTRVKELMEREGTDKLETLREKLLARAGRIHNVIEALSVLDEFERNPPPDVDLSFLKLKNSLVS